MLVGLRDATVTTSGGKAATLGTLLRAGVPVPDGFVIPFDAYREVHALGDDRPGDRPGVALAGLPEPLGDALARGLRRLGDIPVAVRSSASDEDAASASTAGQYESVLGVIGRDQVARAVRQVWASLGSARATAYRGALAGTPAMAVLVQPLIDADASGVMFTPSADDGATVIESAWGLGPSVVGGTVTPDTCRVGRDGSVTIVVADKRTFVGRDGPRPVPAADRERPSLGVTTAVQLARLGEQVAEVLGGQQDVEWAVAGGRAWILQARPVTAGIPPAPDDVRFAPPGALTGTPGSAGWASGPARVVRGPADFPRVRPGDVLVCLFTDPAWTPLLRVAAAVVTQTGGMLSHAAIVARERRIPAVLGVPDVTTRIHDGDRVTVDGATGVVTLT
ncbi:PEP/pyruvate-binding domain-containing protein [Antribacter gilvus]|uniref:PEP/pyruvate-binding domain-containing protein n=1 Tax=Antribacter gilvus TaxID=2304675 RepID=UPI000F76D066|nr:PEP/pyruvate-binding domain-containing protein [Antribacter gilvus]